MRPVKMGLGHSRILGMVGVLGTGDIVEATLVPGD